MRNTKAWMSCVWMVWLFVFGPCESVNCLSLHVCLESDFGFDFFMRVVANILKYNILKFRGKWWRYEGLKSHHTKTSDLESFYWPLAGFVIACWFVMRISLRFLHESCRRHLKIQHTQIWSEMNKYILLNQLDLEDDDSGDEFRDTWDFMDIDDDYTLVIWPISLHETCRAHLDI